MNLAGCDANIPIWDGRADSLREFQQDGGMVASLHQLGEDEGVQPRFAMKQRDAAKIRALEFSPGGVSRHIPQQKKSQMKSLVKP